MHFQLAAIYENTSKFTEAEGVYKVSQRARSSEVLDFYCFPWLAGHDKALQKPEEGLAWLLRLPHASK
jgi:hypothetical protein